MYCAVLHDILLPLLAEQYVVILSVPLTNTSNGMEVLCLVRLLIKKRKQIKSRMQQQNAQ